MEHVSVKRKNGRIIISHKIERNEQINSMVLDIINKQEIPGLFPVQIRQTLTGRKIHFDIQNYSNLQTLLGSNIDFCEFGDIIIQIIDTLQSCESHGVPSGNLEFSSNLTFYDCSRKKIHMLCWPLISLSTYTNVAAFFLDLGNTYVSKQNDRSYQQRYVNYFEKRARFDVFAFKEYVESLLKEWRDEREEKGRGEKLFRESLNHNKGPKMTARNSEIRRVSTGTTVEITKYPFSIGRMAGYADYVIETDRSISKIHAVIDLKHGKYYVCDNGSLNGTLLNGVCLPRNEEIQLTAGDCIQIGKEEFVFYTEYS